MKMKIKRLYDDAKIPTYGHPGDAGMDLYVVLGTWGFHDMFPGEARIFTTGVAMEIPEGFVGVIRPRSGLAVKKGVDILTSGVIDSGYRGEILVNMINHSKDTVRIENGDRIAQMLILPVYQAEFIEVSELSETSRGAGAHGSTGV
jgi:dUTP pyrophosphatase